MHTLPDHILRAEGMRVLQEKFGLVDAERFIAIVNRERFDYTQWRQENILDDETDIEALSDRLMNESRNPPEVP